MNSTFFDIINLAFNSNIIFDNPMGTFTAETTKQCCCETKDDISTKANKSHIYRVSFCLDGKNHHIDIPGVSIKAVTDNFWEMTRTMDHLFGDWSVCEVINCERCD